MSEGRILAALLTREYYDSAPDYVMDEAKKQAPSPIKLLLVEPSFEVLIVEADAHEPVDVVLVLPQDEAGLVLHHRVIVVQSRGYGQSALFHKVYVLELSVIIFGELFGKIFFENLYKLDVRLTFVFEDLIGDHGIYGACGPLRIPLGLVAVTHGYQIVHEVLKPVVKQVDFVLRKHRQDAEHQREAELGQRFLEKFGPTQQVSDWKDDRVLHVVGDLRAVGGLPSLLAILEIY